MIKLHRSRRSQPIQSLRKDTDISFTTVETCIVACDGIGKWVVVALFYCIVFYSVHAHKRRIIYAIAWKLLVIWPLVRVLEEWNDCYKPHSNQSMIVFVITAHHTYREQAWSCQIHNITMFYIQRIYPIVMVSHDHSGVLDSAFFCFHHHVMTKWERWLCSLTSETVVQAKTASRSNDSRSNHIDEWIYGTVLASLQHQLIPGLRILAGCLKKLLRSLWECWSYIDRDNRNQYNHYVKTPISHSTLLKRV